MARGLGTAGTCGEGEGRGVGGVLGSGSRWRVDASEFEDAAVQDTCPHLTTTSVGSSAICFVAVYSDS